MQAADTSSTCRTHRIAAPRERLVSTSRAKWIPGSCSSLRIHALEDQGRVLTAGPGADECGARITHLSGPGVVTKLPNRFGDVACAEQVAMAQEPAVGIGRSRPVEAQRTVRA